MTEEMNPNFDNVPEHFSETELFAGDENFYKSLKNATPPSSQPTQGGVSAAAILIARLFKRPNMLLTVLVINVALVSLVMIYLLLSSPKSLPVNGTPKNAQQSYTAQQTTSPQVVTSAQPAEKKAISWELAETLYQKKDYIQAYAVYEKLGQGFSTKNAIDELIKDFLKLKMALCVYNTAETEKALQLFTACLQSRSPAIKTLANYNLIFVELHKKQYLNARLRAYRTIALLQSLDKYLSPVTQIDCDFLIAEAMTKLVLSLHNADTDLPGKLWTVSLSGESLPKLDQTELRDFVQTGVEQFASAYLGPDIRRYNRRGPDAQWLAVSLEAPVEEVLVRFCSTAGLELCWQSPENQGRDTPVSLCLPAASQQDVLEITAGCAGLVASIDDRQVVVFNPNTYSSLEKYKDLLNAEAISLCRKFLLRRHNDQRLVNIHFALALLQNCANEPTAAIAEYQMIAQHFTNSSLAPYALLECSRIKTRLGDYTGAKNDLNELVALYPDCKVTDQAYLNLAQATMDAGLYSQAAGFFSRIYHTNQSSKPQTAALGAAKCFFELKDYSNAQQWLLRYLKVADSAPAEDVRGAYVILGKTQSALGKHQQASEAFRCALWSNRAAQKQTDQPAWQPDEYCEVIRGLADSQAKQQNFVEAIVLLDNMSTGPVSEKTSAQMLATKARIFRLMALPERSIATLEDRIDYFHNPDSKALLSFELAKSYQAAADLHRARDILTQLLLETPSADLTQQINCELADICLQLGQTSQAINIAIQLLNSSPPPEIYNKTSNTLGTAYTRIKEYDKAALAFSGIFDPNDAKISLVTSQGEPAL